MTNQIVLELMQEMKKEIDEKWIDKRETGTNKRKFDNKLSS